jgi:hypothetical protein
MIGGSYGDKVYQTHREGRAWGGNCASVSHEREAVQNDIPGMKREVQ